MLALLPGRCPALALGLGFALLAACSKAPETAVAQRYLYVVNCDATVDKIDTIEGKAVQSFSLRERSGSRPAIAVASDGKMDGCLAQRVLADTAGQQVHLIAPKDARLDSEGLQDFQQLTFKLPDWALLANKPAGKSAQAPWLQSDLTGGARVVADAEWSVQTQLDVRAYRGANADTGGLVIATSGAMALLSVLSANSESLALGLADQTARTLVRLGSVPTTNLRSVHLAPGGEFVLIEATDGAQSGAVRSGALHLFDRSGKAVAQWQDERIRNMAWVAITPSGAAVYHSGKDYHFVNLGRRFGSAPVNSPAPAQAGPGLVFAAH